MDRAEKIIKKNLASIILNIVLFCITILYRFSDSDRIFLYDTNLDSYFSFFSAVLCIFFIGILFVFFYSLGKYISNRFKLDITFSVTTAIGITFFNIILLPFFFARLLYYPILIILLFFISFLTYKELNTAFISLSTNLRKKISDFIILTNIFTKSNNKKRKSDRLKSKIEKIEQNSSITRRFWITIKNWFTSEIGASNQIEIFSKILSVFLCVFILFAIGLHFINAISPINYNESLGDVANSYFEVFMNLANYHGLKFIQNVAGSLSKYLNFEVLVSTIIILSNSESVKLFGFFIFILLSLMVYDLCKYILKSSDSGKGIKNTEWASFAMLFLILCPAFLFQTIFSFAHDRNYYIFLSFLSFFLLFIGIEKKEMKYHYINLPIMGVLFGVNQSGTISVALNFLIMFLFSKEWRRNLKLFSLFFFIFLCISSVFPIWNYIHSGSFMPTNVLFGKLFVKNINPDVYNLYLSKRIGLQFNDSEKPLFSNFLFFPFRFVYSQYFILAIPFLLGLVFAIRYKELRIFYFYIFSSMIIYMFLFKNSVILEVQARFYFVTLPFIIISIAYVMSKWNFLNIIKSPQRNITISLIIIIIVALIHIDNHYALNPVSKLSMRRRIVSQLTTNLDYIRKNITFGDYIGNDNIKEIQFLNTNFTQQDKILFFFHAKGIYVKPKLYQNTKSGVSILYTSGDQKQILSKFQKLGISYLCLESKSVVSLNNAFGAMVADITTPIFEPGFFAKHFIPLENNISDMYVYRINYDEIKNENEITFNSNKIEKTGFYKFIYKSIKNRINNEKLVRIDLNPYKLEKLLEEYEKYFPQKTLDSWLPKVKHY